MKALRLPIPAWLVPLAIVLAMFASGNADALTLVNLKGQQLEDIYGTYAPRGDCKREPRVTVDDSGFAYAYAGTTTHSRSIESALTYMGQDYQGISRWFFPFPVGEHDFGRVLMTFNPDEKAGTLMFEPNLGPGQTLSPLQAALVKGSPYARCGNAPMQRPPQPRVESAPAAAAVPLSWDSLPALVGKYQGDFDLFGSGAVAVELKRLLGGRLGVLRRNLQVGGPLRREDDVYYLSGNAPHRGGEDQAYILFDAGHHALQVGLWENGKLQIHSTPGSAIAPPADIRKLLDKSPPSDAVASPGRPWEILPVDGRPPIALATAAASPAIKYISVFCDGGQPRLAMLLNRATTPGALTFSMVFRGGMVNLPMTRGNREATFWIAVLGPSSPLPSMLASQEGVAYLRINGVMQGEVSMQGAAAATRSVLGDCYAY
jgi:hypothetical protein